MYSVLAWAASFAAVAVLWWRVKGQGTTELEPAERRELVGKLALALGIALRPCRELPAQVRPSAVERVAARWFVPKLITKK